MSVLVRLMGGFSVHVDGRIVNQHQFPRRAATSLVKVLALAPHHRLHREQVMDQLWPRLPAADATNQLHKAAHHARRATGAADCVSLRNEEGHLGPGQLDRAPVIGRTGRADPVLLGSDHPSNAVTITEAHVSLFLPETQPPARPSNAELAAPGAPNVSPAEDAANRQARILYIRSYLFLRAIIGLFGVSLPVLLVIGDSWFAGGLVVRGSLSGYYYSGLRDFFVASLFAAGFFLITYKVFERSLNNVLSVIGGLAAMVVGLFPTARPDGDLTPLTPLQERLGDLTVSHVHYAGSGVFIVSLAIISYFFGLQEGRRSPERIGRRSRLSPMFWRWFHWVCALGILLSVAYVVAAKNDDSMMTDYTLFIGETVALVLFGLSWLFKGLELDILLGPNSSRTARPAPPPSPTQ